MKLPVVLAVGLIVGGCSTGEPEQGPRQAVAAVSEKTSMEEHLVRVHIPLKGDTTSREEFDRYSSLEDVLDKAAQDSGAGSLDGNEIGGGEYTIWLYGPDGAKLAAAVKGALKDEKLPAGSKIFIRHGGVDDDKAREETIPLP